jgi:hypothetical protein
MHDKALSLRGAQRRGNLRNVPHEWNVETPEARRLHRSDSQEQITKIPELRMIQKSIISGTAAFVKGAFFFFITLILLLSACSPTPEFTPTFTIFVPETPIPLPQEYLAQPQVITTGEPVVLNPLTGLPPADPALLNRRPVMIKVSNYPHIGRPHAGLSFADIVFDYYIGSGTNRFLAIFYGNDSPQVGPVRSGRFVDAQLATMYSGVLGYGSADEDTDEELVSRLGNYAINNLEAPCPAFCGSATHDAIGVFARSDAISDFVDAQGWENRAPDLAGMVFSNDPPLGGKIAEKALILFNYYNRGEWRYDTASGRYLRWIESFPDVESDAFEMIPLVDRVTGQQLAFSNIIIIRAENTELAPSRHLIDIWGNDKGLPAYFFRDGQMVEGFWRTFNDSDPMQFFDKEGNVFPLKPGNTWIVIAGLSSTFKEIQPGEWEMFFFLP